MPAYLARTGLVVFAMLFALTLFTEHVAEGSALVAGTSSLDLPPLREISANVVGPEVVSLAVAVAGSETTPAEVIVGTPAAQVPSVAVAVGPAQAAPAVVAIPVQLTEGDAIVLASWYGPGFYGNRTACGQTYTPEILGVAHKTLPCGTVLTLTYGTRALTVAVIDRGPYVAGRTLDLSNATKLALGCTDLCTLRMQIGK